MNLLFLALTVGAFGCLQSACSVTFEVLSQPGAGGEALGTSLTPVGLVTTVDSTVVDKVALRSKSLPALMAGEGSLARVFSYVN